MIADYNLKAVVFDDREEEAKPLIDALNYERIPNIFINIKDDSRDDKKLQNIRIVFADLILGEYVSGDDNGTIEAIRASILDNISVDNGPFILVAWSKHSKLVVLLKKRILEIAPKLNFLTVELDKNTYFQKENDGSWIPKDNNQFSIISQDIAKQLKELEYLEIFLEWEKDAKNSISKILNNFLSDISNKEKISKNISATIKSTIGSSKALKEKEKLDAFYRTLNRILSDSIENNVAPESKHDIFLRSLDLENLDQNLKAEINSKTLFEKILDGDKTLKNGNIYSFEEFRNNFYGDIIKDVCGYDINSIFKDELFEFRKEGKLFEKKNAESQEDFSNRHLSEYYNYSYPIVLEFTPSCDIAQRKYKKSRLIFGFLLDSRYKCIKNESESLYITKFHFQLKNDSFRLNSNYRLVFFMKHVFALNPEKVKEMTPIIRVRKELVTDLQHAIANHISRIGISSIDSKWN